MRTTDNRRKRPLAICTDCDTHIDATSAEDADLLLYCLRISTLRQRGDLATLIRQMWNRSRTPSVVAIAEIGTHETR